MIKGIYIFLTNGLPVFHYGIKDEGQILDEILFAGVSSAIDIFMKELGHQSLYSINTNEGSLIYTSSNNLLFVVHAFFQEDETIPEFLVKQIEIEFQKAFADILETSDFSYVDRTLYEPFRETAQEIYDKLMQLYTTSPIFFEIFPKDEPLFILLELIEKGGDLIDGYPEDTIRLVRNLDEKYEERNKKTIIQALGKYFGYEIAQENLRNKVTANISDILKWINEIAIAKYDSENENVKLEICPICRQKTADTEICYFFSGFIEGCFNNPKITVVETHCKAKGDKNCVFKINYR